MRSKLTKAGVVAVAASLLTTLATAQGSGAFAQDNQPVLVPASPQTTFDLQPVEQPQSSSDASTDAVPAKDADAPVAATAPFQPPRNAMSLAALVSTQSATSELSPELNCLAGAIYFESKGESLPGQLAVGRVVVARSRSGRFPASYCGVVYQPSQFSFVRGRAMPSINRSSPSWRQAVAIARIADQGAWKSPAEGALFFHAARVSPGWNRPRVARIDNHIFYR
jgi:spore germination cell wall hydrolase CwlJ-like protein